MRAILLLVLSLAGLHAQTYPDVPGKADPKITQANIHETICNTHYKKKNHKWQSYSRTVRPKVSWTNALKHRYMAEGKLPGKLNDYELDHDLAISNGGCPNCEDNLRMELWPEAKQKDVIEGYIHREICAEHLTLEDGQRMQLDWTHVDVNQQEKLVQQP